MAKDKLPGEVTIHIWSDGDPIVGIPGNQATITTFVEDTERLHDLKQSLRKLFSKFWDWRIASVSAITEAELVDDVDDLLDNLNKD